MPDPKPPKNPQPESKQTEKAKSEEKPLNPNELSEDEQMAPYEKDLKDSDRGHPHC